MTAVDQIWDQSSLDFFHLPFEADLPQSDLPQSDLSGDLLEQFSFSGTRDTVDYSTSILTPPPSTGVSDDELFESVRFSFPLAESAASYDTSAASDHLFGVETDVEHLTSANWVTPPASPPASSQTAPATQNHPLLCTNQLFEDITTSESSDDGEAERTSSDSKGLTAKRRKPSVGTAGKAVIRKGSKVAVAKSSNKVAESLVALDAETDRLSNDETHEPESKRKTHNVLERKRRNDLKKSYQALRMQLPNLSDNSRAPTGHILIKAVEYIRDLKKEESSLLDSLKQLRSNNEQARARLQSFSS